MITAQTTGGLRGDSKIRIDFDLQGEVIDTD
jgi:hypothetical protein